MNTASMVEETKNETVKVNDIFYASWGYDQTNINFYKVVEISKTGKSCKAVHIGQQITEHTGFMSERVAPNPEIVLQKEPVTLKIRKAFTSDDVILRGSHYYCSAGESKHLGSLYKYKSPMHQSHYA